MEDGLARVGVLLLNLGTPDSPSVRDVRRYLREFLSDPRVLDTNALGRALLLYGWILPLRPRRSAAAYRKIWTERGSPLLVHGRALADSVAKDLGPGFAVELAMRYGEPSIEAALERLAQASVERTIVLPLFPQYAGASTGSALERVYALAGRRWNVAALSVLPPFYGHPDFIRALEAVVRPEHEVFRPQHLLLSYHGLPERQIRRSEAAGRHCLAGEACCDAMGPANRYCYRAQCFATSRALAAGLDLADGEWSVSFQSRLGRTPWIRPYTDRVLPELADRGIRRLLVACPSFASDCLETVEEIGIRAASQWQELGGGELRLAPCLNDHPSWAQAVAGWVRTAAGARTPAAER